MGRIVFFNLHPKHLISGGVKTVYRQVELLNELGLEACVFQPAGKADWFTSCAPVFTTLEGAPSPDETVVFLENSTGWAAELAQTRLRSRKVLFCQNQYYMFDSTIPPERYGAVDFTCVVCPSEIAQRFLANVFGWREISVIPPFVDSDIFFPRPKTMRIALQPFKQQREAALLRAIFQTKYPHLKSIPWDAIVNTSEEQTAELLGRAAICLSLSRHESVGLVPLEAMASGCIVAGFHGYGGLEYASPENGFWFGADYLEEVADALATAVEGIEKGDERMLEMQAAGAATAAHYSRQRAKHALETVYRPMSGAHATFERASAILL